jgi:DHA3 family macrolide efflux protein-like MFS transporter
MTHDTSSPANAAGSSTIAETDRWQPRFWAIWTGQALSLIGSALTQFVLVWWITSKTGSPSAVAIAGMMAMLPQAIFAPIGGAFADRYSRRLIMIVTDSITALCMLILIALFATGLIETWHAYTLMFVRSTMQAFQLPASAASTPMLVPRSWLERVAGFNQLLQGIMSIAAAPLGALALGFFPIQGALAIDVVTALLGITPLFFFKIPQVRAAPTATANNLLSDVRAGVGYIRRWPGMRHLLIVLGLVVFTVMPVFSLMPLLITSHFKGGVNEVALMEGLAGVGMILGGLLMTVWRGFSNRMITMLVMFALSCATAAFGAVVPGTMLWAGVVGYFLSGATYSVGNVPLMAVIQSAVPNQMLGRVNALMSMLMGFAGPIGLLAMGTLGEWAGIRAVFIVGAGSSALLCLAALLSKPLLAIEHNAPVLAELPAPEPQTRVSPASS